MILAVLTEKYFKLWMNIEWPRAVVTKAKMIIYGIWVFMFSIFIVNITGNKITDKIKIKLKHKDYMLIVL